MEENTSKESVPKKQLTKWQMVAVEVVGGLMLLLSIVIHTDVPSTAHTIKVIAGMLGACIMVAGAYFRPVKAPKNPKG